MIRYDTIKLTIPANGEKSGTILTIPDGKKVSIYALGKSNTSDMIVYLSIEGDKIIEAPADFYQQQGQFIAINIDMEGPQEIIVGGINSSVSSKDMYFCVAYEEK